MSKSLHRHMLPIIAYTVKTALTVTSSSPYSQLSVTPLRFHYLFDNCITIPSQCSHGQPFCTPKWPLMAKAMITDGQLNHLQKRLRSLFIAFSLYGLRIYLQTMELTDDPICLVLSTQIRFVASHMA